MSKKKQANRDSRAVEVSLTPEEGGAAVTREPSAKGRPLTEWRDAYRLIPVALAIIASINVIWNGFVLDDIQQIISRPFIGTLAKLPSVFTTGVAPSTAEAPFLSDFSYRPVLSVLFMISHALFGDSPWGWHLMSVLIHAAVTWLVFVMLSELTGRQMLAALAAALFAVHPSHAESIAWVSAVAEPLMALFLVPSFYFYLKYRKSGAGKHLWLALGLYLFALWSKESALVFPLLIVLYEFICLRNRAPIKAGTMRALKIAGIFALPAVIYLGLRYAIIGRLSFGGDPIYPVISVIRTAPLALVKYLKLALIPTGYSYLHYTVLVASFASLSFLLLLGLLAALTAVVAFIRSRALTFAALWFVVMLVPALTGMRYFDPEHLIQESLLYLPSIGFCLAVATGIEWLAIRNPSSTTGRVAAVVATTVIVIVWGAVYIRQNHTWQETMSVYRNAVAAAPSSPVAHASLGHLYFDSGRPREAEAETQTALDLDSKCASAYINMSYFAQGAGKTNEAIDYLERATKEISEEPMTRKDLSAIYLNLSLLYIRRNDIAQAEQSVLRSKDIWPRPAAWYYAGLFYYDQSRFQEALDMFSNVLGDISPTYPTIYLKLGDIYEQLGQKERARASYRKFLEIAPADAPERRQVSLHLLRL